MSELSKDQIILIAAETAGQAANKRWREIRNNKLTGSYFGRAIRAAKDRSAPATRKLVIEIRCPPNLDHIPAVKWGKQHEIDGIYEYCKQTGRHVKETGIWLFPNGCMGASPDGLVFEESDRNTPVGILEVKCPYSLRECGSEWTYKTRPRFLRPDNKIRESHDYYHQIQGQLYATGQNWCDLVVWTPRKTLITRVWSKHVWSERNLPLLIKFYNESLNSGI